MVIDMKYGDLTFNKFAFAIILAPLIVSCGVARESTNTAMLNYSGVPCDVVQARHNDNGHYAENYYKEYYEKMTAPKNKTEQWLQTVFVKYYLTFKNTSTQAVRCGFKVKTLPSGLVELGEKLSKTVQPSDL